jgi:PAS domain S-box-containing protein
MKRECKKKRDAGCASKKRYGTTEEAPYGAEDKFMDLAERSLAGIYLIQDQLFKYVNPRVSEIFGYTAEEIVEKMGPQDLVLPEDWHRVNKNILMRISGETKALHYECRGVKKGGETINIEVYGSWTVYQGKPAVMGTLLDISKRKRAEELLRQTEAKYRSIFENAQEGIFQITPQGQFIVTNPALQKMLGYNSPEEQAAMLLDGGRQFFVEPEYLSDFICNFEKDGIVQGFECEFYKKNGDRIWVSMNARTVRDENNNTLYYEGTVQDITEKKKAQDELRRLNDFSSAIINNAPVAIFTLDTNGVFTHVSPALTTVFGLEPGAEKELIGFNWLKDPYTVKCGLAGYFKAGLRGKPFQLWDFPNMTYSGERNLYMDVKGVPLRGKDGVIEGLLCIVEETTERVKTQAKLMEQAKMLIIGRLAAGIAHELNNPLAALVAHSELAGHCLKVLQESIGEHPALDELKSYLETIEAQAFRCKGVANDIIDLPWKEGLEKQNIDINGLLRSILEFANIHRSNVNIIRDMPYPLPPVGGDISALRQVFVNLINNAVDAVEGKVDATIYIRTRINCDFIEVEIEDNGVGFPDGISDRIFEPFFTTKRKRRGGLGLPLCKELLSHMGGTIEAESKPDCGTSFLVRLPAHFMKR